MDSPALGWSACAAHPARVPNLQPTIRFHPTVMTASTSPRGRIMVVTDLDMRRLDTQTEFNFQFLTLCAERGLEVEYVLPTRPVPAVLERLAGANFKYT